MTPEQQRIAIAEACGWKDTHCTGGLPCGIAPNEREHRQLPAYLNDLNSMHEAEKIFLFSQRQRYYKNLVTVLSKNITNARVADIECARATAAQRAEAFLRTLNLWQNS